eukprot:scaffold25040_cov130-Isochrysis_galbana.AAC.9
MSGSGLCALLQPVRVGFVTDALCGESNLRILFSTLPPFRSTTASVAAHARSPLLAQRAAARPCRPSELIEHSSADST